MKKVAIIIPNYNGIEIKYKGKSILKLCLEALEKTEYPDYNIIIVDDKSTDSSLKYLATTHHDIIPLEKNLNHFSKEHNIGWRYAIKKYNPDYYIMLNNDMIITDKNWLREMVKAAEETKAGIMDCSLIPQGARKRKGGITKPSKRTTIPIMISKECQEKVGLLDEGFLTGWEDMDYCLRAEQAKLRIMTNNSVNIIHLEGFSTTKHKDASRRDYRFLGDRISMLHFITKHYDVPCFREKWQIIKTYFGSCIFQNWGGGGLKLRDKKAWRIWKSTGMLFHSIFIGRTHTK